MSRTFEEYMEFLQDVTPGDKVSLDTEFAIDAALDSMAFSLSLWNLLKDQGLITDSEEPDFVLMERAIDALYGELAAVTLMFTEESFKLAPYVEKVITLFEGTSSTLDKANVGHVVPPEVVQGFKSFAARLKNAALLKKSLGAQKIP